MAIDVDNFSMINVHADRYGALSLVCLDHDLVWEQLSGGDVSLARLIDGAQQHVRELHDGAPHSTCVEITGHAEMVAGTRAWAHGKGCPTTDGEAITERAGFTQRDVDPLGRGDTAQRERPDGACKVTLERLGAWPAHTCPPMDACSCPIREACVFEQASDQAKRDENTLRSENR